MLLDQTIFCHSQNIHCLMYSSRELIPSKISCTVQLIITITVSHTIRLLHNNHASNHFFLLLLNFHYFTFVFTFFTFYFLLIFLCFTFDTCSSSCLISSTLSCNFIITIKFINTTIRIITRRIFF